MTKPQIKILDKLWQQTIVAQDGKCLKCGKRPPNPLTGHHIFSRTNRSTRWDLDNGIALCSWQCHINFAHRNPTEFTRWLEGIKGRPFITKLRKKANTIVKNQDYGKIKTYLEGELQRWLKS